MEPGFICIGSPKSGTTWLYRQLLKHPNIWVPPVKELHYFDKLYPILKYGERRNVKWGLMGFYRNHNRRLIIRVLGRAALDLKIKNIFWAHRYFGGDWSDDWYLSLFDAAKDKMGGELTTDYCALSDDGVAHVKRLAPQVRVIYFMRDPIARAWSHTKMLLPQLLNKPFDVITDDELLDYLTHPAVLRKGEHFKTISTWEKHFGQDQIFTAFFEEVIEKPEDLLKRVHEFLGVRSDIPSTYAKVREQVNVSKKTKSMPISIRQQLAQEFINELELLSERFGNYAETWREKARGLLANDRI